MAGKDDWFEYKNTIMFYTRPDNTIMYFTIELWKGLLARIFHELLSRDHEDGRATWQPSRGTAGLDSRRT
jgi:hypothetical protein